MTDSDNDLPDLVDSSDDDLPTVKESKTNADCAESWLQKPQKFLDKQDHWLRVFCLAPFLFAINNIAPSAWIKALIHAKLLINDKRQYELTFLEWTEWECVDLIDDVIPIVLKRMRDRKVLVSILDCLVKLEECRTGVIIDVDLAIQEAEKCLQISEIWREVMKSEHSDGKEKAAKFSALYVMKLYELHVLSIGKKSQDYVKEMQDDLRMTHSYASAEQSKNEGNSKFNKGKFDEAIDDYSKAAKADPLNHIYYGNRAQAYSRQKKYNEALADSRRAVTLKPDWAKGHYRYAQAFSKLGRLDTAIKANSRGLELCQNAKESDKENVKQLEAQGKKFAEEREGTTEKGLTSIPKGLAKKLGNIADPNKGMDYWDSDRNEDTPPPMVSSDSDSDSPPQKDVKAKKKTKKHKSSDHKNSDAKPTSDRMKGGTDSFNTKSGTLPGMPDQGHPQSAKDTLPMATASMPSMPDGIQSKSGMNTPVQTGDTQQPAWAQALLQMIGDMSEGTSQLPGRNIIWRGKLEWQDKDPVVTTGPNSRIARSLDCRVSIAATDLDISTINWGSTLTMQLMPAEFLNSAPLHPLLNPSRQVEFHFHKAELEALASIYRVLSTGFVGCVHFPSSPRRELRVLILLYSLVRNSFIGLIPREQNAMVDGIRQVITKHKETGKSSGSKKKDHEALLTRIKERKQQELEEKRLQKEKEKQTKEERLEKKQKEQERSEKKEKEQERSEKKRKEQERAEKEKQKNEAKVRRDSTSGSTGAQPTVMTNGVTGPTVQPTVKRPTDKEELKEHMKEGSEAMVKDNSKAAMMYYQKALDMTAHHDNKVLGLDETDIITLKYTFGMAAIETKMFKSIQDGIEKMRDIIENHQEVRFPMAHYGLGKAYATLNRFPEAISPLQNGLNIAKRVTFPTALWPGTDRKILESNPEQLRKYILELIHLCRYPPQPDAMCRYHTDTQDTRTVIFYSDPDFKGFIEMVCQLHCVIAFHPNCWKEYKAGLNKPTDKETLETNCPTPDCSGLIMKISIIRQDSQLNKEHVSERLQNLKEHKEKRTMVKQKMTSASKIAQKQERKDLRKQRRRERQEEKDDLLEDVDKIISETKEQTTDSQPTTTASGSTVDAGDQALPDVKEATVLKKEEVEPSKQASGKQKKGKKKKEKRQVLNLEVNFSDRKEETLLGESSVLSDEEAQQKSSQHQSHGFSVPTGLVGKISQFEQSYSGPDQQLFQPDEVTQNLFSYFVDMLEVNGPLAIDDPKIAMELEVFPQEAQDKIKEAGDLKDFLRQSLKFAVIEDVVCLLKDSVRARDIALMRRSEKSKKDRQGGPQDSWTTVGKNNVNSLDESLAYTAGGHSNTRVQPSHSDTSIQTPVQMPASGFPSLPGYSKSSGPPETSSVESLSITRAPPFKKPLQIPSNRSSPLSGGMNDLDSLDDFYSMPSSKSERQVSPGLEVMDSIDDFPVIKPPVTQKKASKLDDLDDFDMVSDTGSDGFLEGSVCSDHDSVASSLARSSLNGEMKLSFSANQDELSVSRSSSRSDVSERSDLSDLQSKPRRPLGALGQGFGAPKNLSVYGSETDASQTSVNKGSSKTEDWGAVDSFLEETNDGSVYRDNGFDSVASEVKWLGEEFVRKNDEKYVSELAESVVEKMYKNKAVLDSERRETLERVKADIWKDFNRSAEKCVSGVGLSGASSNITKSYIGNVADNFMKHYYSNDSTSTVQGNDNIRGTSSPVSSSYNSVPRPVNSGDFSAVSSSWASAAPFVPRQTVNATQASTSGSQGNGSGYNLFSGPPLGFSSVGGVPSPGSFVRPPLSSAPFYTPMGPAPIGMPVRPPSTSVGSGAFSTPFGLSPGPVPAPIKLPCVDKGVQADPPQMVSTAMNTDPYEPYKMEYLRVKEERDGLQLAFREKAAVFDSMLQQLQSKEQQCLAIQDELNNKTGMYDVERRHWESEKLSYGDEISRLTQKLANQETAQTELMTKMMNQEKRVMEIAHLASEQREKDLVEMKRMRDIAEQYKTSYGEQQERARSAEMEIIKSKQQHAVHVLERQMKEAGFHQQQLAGIIKKHQDESVPMPVQLKQTLEHWQNVSGKCEAAKNKIKAEYEGQLMELSQGKNLSELPGISIPSPPPIPDTVKAFMFGSGGIPGKFPGGMQRQPSPQQQTAPRPLSITDGSMTTAPNSSVSMTTGNHMTSSPVPMAASSIPQNPMPAPPKPLNPPQRLNLVPPKPLSGAKGPLGGPPRAPLRSPFPRPLGAAKAIQPPRNSSYEKLITKLQAVFPNCNKMEFPALIQQLRQQRGGSLSGMTIDDIISQISDMINSGTMAAGTRESMAVGQAGLTPIAPKPLAAPPGIGSTWAFRGETLRNSPVGEVFQEEENPCVICHEELTAGSTITLECSHRFHDECIRKWLREQSTCPNCRVHALLPDEFPSLN